MQKRMHFRGVGAYSGEPFTAWLHTQDQVHNECRGEHIRLQCREVYWASVSDSRDHVHTVEVIATLAAVPGKAVPVATVVEVISHDGGHLQDDVDLAIDMIEIGAVFGK